MNVFLILLVALLNTEGNKGDPNYGVRNLTYFQDDLQQLYPYIVSVRNNENCHLSTGSLLSQKYVLTSSQCRRWANVFYGLGEFVNCQESQDEEYMIKIEKQFDIRNVFVILLKLNGTFNPQVAVLKLPTYNIWIDETDRRAVAIGWSCGGRGEKCVKTETARFTFRDLFYDNRPIFEGVGDGAAIIDNGIIFEVIYKLTGRNRSRIPYSYFDLFDIRGWIQGVIDN